MRLVRKKREAVRRPALRRGRMFVAMVIAAATVTSAPGSESWVERSRYLMGTICAARAAGDPATVGPALDAALDRIARLEDVMTTYRPGGALARLNRALASGSPGAPQIVEPGLFAVLETALSWAETTGGRFDPAIGGLIETWDLRGAGRVPSEAEIATALGATSWRLVRLDPSRRSVAASRRGVALDLGGFGKGYALDAARAVLEQRGIGRALINFGGQVLAIGAPVGEPGWVVEIADPRDRRRAVASIRVRDASVATSGNGERFFEVQGRRYGHLLDPRTGRPVERGGSMTVLASTATAADVLATALMVEGPAGAERWPKVGAEFLYLERSRDDGVLTGVGSAGLRDKLNRFEPILWKEDRR